MQIKKPQRRGLRRTKKLLARFFSPLLSDKLDARGQSSDIGMAKSFTDEHVQKIVDSYREQSHTCSDSDRKQLETRVFVNRSVSMEKIKYVGFDMDHTLAVYKSPEYEQLAYDLIIERLVHIGYPQDIKEIKYDPTFPLRGLFFDKTYGNLLKTDQFGNILSCFHGFNIVHSQEVRKMYSNKYVQPLDSRIYILYTLYNLPEVYILAALVNYFDNHPDYSRLKGAHEDEGVQCEDVVILYKMIWQDVREAVDFIHFNSNLMDKTVENLEKYIHFRPELPKFLTKLKESGRMVFIVTNSNYSYTKAVMSYLLPETKDSDGQVRNWRSYFDYVIVDAKKPLFFEEGTMLREVDYDTNSLRLGVFTGSLRKGKVYSGGSSEAFCRYTGAHGKKILYVGDHIFGDVIKAKKEQAWRTFLVIPELSDELSVWESEQKLFTRLKNLEYILAEIYTNEGAAIPTSSDANSKLPDGDSFRLAIKACAEEMEDRYPSQLGSLLRCGSRMTHFAAQSTRFADLYSSSCINLLCYPDSHLFTAPHQLMPHETFVEQSVETYGRFRSLSPELSGKLDAKVLAQRKKSPNALMIRGMSIIEHDMDEDSP